MTEFKWYESRILLLGSSVVSVESLGAISVIRLIVFFAQATWRIPKSLLTSAARNMAKTLISIIFRTKNLQF